MSEKNVTIVTGEQAKAELSDPALIHLTNRVNQIDCGDNIGFLRHAVGRAVRGLLGIRPLTRAIRDNIDPAWYPIEHMKSLRDRGDIAVAKSDRETVGMAGFQFRSYDTESGRPIYEVRRVAVRKKHEGKKIGSQIHSHIVDMIREKDPNALILVEAQDPGMMKICENFGYQECPPERGLRMQYGKEEAPQHLEWFNSTGGKFFILDLSKRTGASSEEEQ